MSKRFPYLMASLAALALIAAPSHAFAAASEDEVPPGRARSRLWLRQGRCVPMHGGGRKRDDVRRGTPAHLDEPVIGPDDAPS